MTYYEIKDIDLAARIGRLKTKSGVFETPYLFPVIDPIRQEVELDTVNKIGFNAIITNAYLYYRRSRGRAKDIHEYLRWNKPIMTDSGGYQVLEYGDVEVTNKTIVSFQKEINVDIGVILDIPTGANMDYKQALEAVNETYKRAWEALPIIQESSTLWVFPIQGAPYRDLVVKSSIMAWKLPYHIHALGSPTVLLERYEYSSLIELVALARMHLPPHRPLHVFGVGHPMIIPFLVALGADLFDSASYILYARDNRYMIEGGTKRLEELEYFPCSCPVCSRYTPKDLLERNPRDRVKLLAMHNLFMLKREIDTVKQAIKEGRLWELIEERSKSHPSLRDAFNVLKKYSEKLLAKYTPLSKGSVSAMLFYDYDTIYNPKVGLFIDNIKKWFPRRYNEIVLIPAVEKPYRAQDFVKKISNLENKDKMFYNLFLGLIPWNLTETYPVFQHEEPRYVDDERLCKYAASIAAEYIIKNNYSTVEIIVVDDILWTKKFAEELRNKLYVKGVNVIEIVTTCTSGAVSHQFQLRKPS
ncbi:tRNA guanosine(15) transglycosylase TgtA [Desulfurococcaceae archaeon MEX13E-LK6-19]|nr:tRNA guanosine(15) transglycosylase TgtA [Desulfurococcaceae archaeon MEX13E-LK6-19]